MMNRVEKIMKRVQEHYDYIKNKGYEIVFIALQGSQNYGLDIYQDDYMSDIDTKAVVLPSLKDITLNKEPKSTTLVLENNEHVDVKDIRIMFDTFKKQNINFIEILFSDFKIINPKYKELVQPLFDNNEEIAHINTNQALRCMAGMSMEKLKALQHPYPTIVDKIKKYGYDPKQLHHIIRMNEFISKYTKGIPYKECLIPKNPSHLISIKKGIYTEDEAVELAKFFDTATKNIKDHYLKEQDEINQKGIEVLNQVKYNILKKRFKEELEREDDNKLEDADLTTIYTNGYFDGEQKWKDKIKEKRDKLIKDAKELTINIGGRGCGKTFQQAVHDENIKLLNELLEEKK